MWNWRTCFSQNLWQLQCCPTFRLFPRKPPKTSHGTCRPTLLMCALAERASGHPLHLPASSPFPSHGTTRKTHWPWKPLLRAVHDIYDRAVFLPADKRQSPSEGTVGWRRAPALRCSTARRETPPAPLLLPFKGHHCSSLSLREKTRINHELRKQKEERTECLIRV